MSTADGDHKKRKVHTACDHCKRKKIRCEGPQSLGMRCSQCITDGSECTYHEAAKRRGSVKKPYIESVENRLKRAEALLAKLHPDKDFSHVLDGTVGIETLTWNGELGRPSKNKPSAPSISLASSRAPYDGASGPTMEEKELDSSDDEQPRMMGAKLSERLERLEIDPSYPRFMGKSSGVHLVYSAFMLKNGLSGKLHDHDHAITMRRPEFWNISPWEESDINHHKNVARNIAYQFPDADLIPQLVDKYFNRVNILVPLLHRPTFEHQVAEQLFLSDTGFAAVLLLVCAIGARYVDDQRVRLDGETSGASAGWRWFNQVQMVRKSLWATPRLVDIQVLVLAVVFLSGSSSAQACWKLTGAGIRYVQDVGAHRRKVYASKPTPNEEMWKRAFWVLVTTDRMISCTLGRPPAIQDEDFDVDVPTDCDDEYWTPAIPEEAFKQPSNKPSHMTCFLHLLKLHQILAFAMRTVYSINKSKTSLGFVGQEWEQRIVAELDSALNKWTDAIPDHLRWDPTREDDIFFDQSALLYSYYYFVQIVVHRPFISAPGKQSPLSFSSLAICTNAARACSHVLDAQQKRTDIPQPYQITPAFTAATVLLVNILGGKRSNVTVDNVKQMSDVHKCMNVLKKCETYWHAAGRFWDILCELAFVSDLPLPQGIPRVVRKRERNSEGPVHFDAPESRKTCLPAQRDIVGLQCEGGQGAHPSGTMGLVDSFRLPSPPGSVPSRAQTGDLARMVQSSHIPVPPLGGNSWGSPPPEITPSTSPIQMLPLLSYMSNSYLSAPSTGPNNVNGDSTAYVSTEQNLWEVDPTYNQLMGPPSQVLSHQHGQEIHDAPSIPLSGMEDQALLNSDTLSMWMNAPLGFELDEWGLYLAGFGELGEQKIDPAIMLP